MIDKRAAGQRIAVLRRGLGYSQAEFAEKLNVSAQAVSKWETGLSLPDIETLLNISWMAKTSINEILDGETFPAQPGLDCGLARISRDLICPACGKALSLRAPVRKENARFVCKSGHNYDVVDGVLDFGAREIEGERWSLFFKTTNSTWQDNTIRGIHDIGRGHQIFGSACGRRSNVSSPGRSLTWPAVQAVAFNI